MAKTYNSIEEFNVALQSAFDGLTAEIGTKLPKMSEFTAFRIKTRVSASGEDGNGNTFSAYSRSHKYKKQKYGKSPYGNIIDNKNFFYQGEMWNSFDFRSIKIDSTSVNAKIGFIGQNAYMSNATLAQKHSDKEGRNIFNPNKDEEQWLVNEIGITIGQYLDRILG